MKYLHTLALALPLAVATASGYAADPAEMGSHHPTVPEAGTAPQKTSKAMPMKNDKMEAQMKTMRAMHEKMMNAKTPEARNALMPQQMKLMQDGMSMMGDMGAHGQMMGGMGAQGKMTNNPSGDTATRQQMMEERMGMMESMMQMMMDRETSSMPPVTPGK